MAITRKDREQIRQAVLTTIQQFKRNADVSVSTTTNAVATGIVFGAVAPLDSDLYRAYVNLVLKDPQALEDEGILDQAILDDYGRINNIFRRQATQALGEAVFVFGGAPTRPIVVPAGTVVGSLIPSNGTVVRFQTTVTVSIDPNDPSAYFIPEINAYGVRVPIRAIQAGTSGNRTAGSITILITAVTGVLDVTNLEQTEGGKEIESNLDYALRIERLRNVPVGISQPGGIETFMFQQPDVEDVALLRAGDTEIKRGTGNGIVDVYVKGNVEQVQTETYRFTGVDFILSVQPVNRVAYVRIAGNSLIQGVGYQFIKDETSAYAGSARAQDRIRLLTPPNQGDTVAVSYRVNTLPGTLTNLVNNESNLTPGSDIVVYSAKAVPIFVQVSVRRDPAFNIGVVSSNVRDAVVSYITQNSGIAVDVPQSALLQVIQSANGVVGIDVSNFQTRRLSDLSTVNGDIDITRLEYASADITNINVTVLN